MKTFIWRVLTLTMVAAFVLTACGGNATQAPPAPATQPPAQATQAPAPTTAAAAPSTVNITHYFSDALGKKYITQLIDSFDAATPQFKVVDNTTGHEDFKTQILVMLAGNNPPDIFSYWAGARTQFVVDANRLMPLDDWWAANKMDDVIPASLKPLATYNGKIYAVPMNAHIVAMFYNPKVMAKAGITTMPATWADFLAACDKLKAAGVAPLALGSKNQWPAQYWFDYLVSRTAGPDYRTQLMAGKADYTDPQVAKALSMWKDLIDKGYFVKNANAYDWTDAADQVAKGDAAMTLMGTWITGYWDGKGLTAGTDYDFFPFPVIDPSIPVVVHGSIDAWTIPADTHNKAGAEALMASFLSPQSQAIWAKGQGALAANKNTDPSIYNSVMKEAADYLAKTSFLSGYDLSTTPPMATGGLNMFAEMMNDPSKFQDYMNQTETVEAQVFNKTAPTPAPTTAAAAQSTINITHYFSDALGKKYITQLIDSFDAATPQFKVVDNTTGHEDFKTQILVMLAGNNPPDIFSYWAGARTQFVVDANRLMPLDDWWAANKMDDVIPASLKPLATYNGKIYAVPMNAHIVAMFYNPKVMAKAGITTMPATWADFLAACDKLKAAGVAPLALGSKNQWPAQYWFDYLVSRTAGPDYRTQLMAGKADYTDPQVAKALSMWKDLIDKGYFVKNANAYDWTDAADQVAKGDAAMTLMGTWITGYWDGKGLTAGTDYDFFPFPVIDPSIPVVVHGSIDAWTIPADTHNKAGAEALMASFLSPQSQAIWAKGQGALAANKNTDPSIYNSVMKEAADYLAKTSFLSGYDLSTTPPMATGGLNMFAEMMNDPSKFQDYMNQTEVVEKQVFNK